MKTELFYEKGVFVLFDRDSEKTIAIFDRKPTTIELQETIFRFQKAEEIKNKIKFEVKI